MDWYGREIAEKEVGRMILSIMDGLSGTDYFKPAIESTAVFTLETIRGILDDEALSDFECVEEIVTVLAHAGITTNRHDFG